MKQKYFKTLSAARKACDQRNSAEYTTLYHVYRMPKGSRHHGEFAVCTFLDYINTY